MEIEFLCPDCNHANQKEIADSDVAATFTCESCGKTFGPVNSYIEETKGLQRCVICGCRDLYTQKDFNRKVGCTIAAIGAILAPFTKLISLFVCALIDLLLYRLLPTILVCYRCKSIYRDFPPNAEHQPFNLGINDRYQASTRGSK
jgi:hypothetical protein